MKLTQILFIAEVFRNVRTDTQLTKVDFLSEKIKRQTRHVWDTEAFPTICVFPEFEASKWKYFKYSLMILLINLPLIKNF